ESMANKCKRPGSGYNGVLKFFPTAEGYVEPQGSSYNYVYQYKDHLGNIRLSYDKTLAIKEESNYYPFGLKHEGYNTVKTGVENKYRFGGKELQDELGLNMYDFGARNYDPALGRWMNIDPLAEKYPNISPYVYVANNPINAIDPDGRDIIFVVRGGTRKQDQQFTYRKGNFYHADGTRYNPGKESVSKTMYKVLTAYRAIEKSDDKDLKHKLHTLENSKQKHYIDKGADHQNEVGKDPQNPSISDAEKKVKEGVPVDTQTSYNFSDATKKRLAELQGVPDDDLSIVAHEMSHQYDYDQGENGDSVGVPASAQSPTEIRAVKTENRARKISGLPKRTTYSGEAIDPKKLNN
ncbi:RHS repeat domain-containing protein, partial [Flavobacterium collinsii]|uniref:RHS repeat domain-containing protein n=1 Tax=Flavobacterium collinsii TaxID=1114861 RepID=UPI002493A5AB